MRAGDLDRRVSLQRATVTLDSFGGEQSTWTTLATVSAQHLPVSDGERVRAAQTGAALTDRFRIRWGSGWSDLNSKDQLIFEGRYYQVTGVKPIGRRLGLEVTAIARG